MQSSKASVGFCNIRRSLLEWRRAFCPPIRCFNSTNLTGMEAANFSRMRMIKLSGREASVVRAIGFTNSMLGAEIQDYVRMESDDVTDALNSLMAAGFVESVPYAEQIELAEMPVTSFEINPAYSHELKRALLRS
jgi:hypothetical protein